MKKKTSRDAISDRKKVFDNSTASAKALKSAREKLTSVFQRMAQEFYSHTYRVLIKKVKDKEQIKGGIIIPYAVKEAAQEAIVVAL